MLCRMSAKEFTEWQAYELVAGPLGPERSDIQAAMIAATVANTVSKKKFKTADFMPKWDKGRRQQSWQDQLAAVKAINASLGGSTREVRK